MASRTGILLACILAVYLVDLAACADGPPKLRTVKIRSIELRIPTSWKRVETTSQFRMAEFAIPAVESDGETADLVVYYFGNSTGGVRANIERWVGQFGEKGRGVTLTRGQGEQGKYFLADISGTWKQPVGPPFARKTVDKPNNRVIGVILLAGKGTEEDYYFLKLSGPDALVKSLGKPVRVMIGADPKSEQPYKMNEKKVVRSEREWRELLTPKQYRVLRQKGTERPFTNKYDKHFAPGTYACAACGQELFSATTKFNSGCGWPAFYAAKAGDRVTLTPDRSLNMVRTEVCCARCDSHLGHVFDDAPQTPTGQRFCINSVSLKFIPAKDQEKQKTKP